MAEVTTIYPDLRSDPGLDYMGFGYDEAVWLPREFHPTREAARRWFMDFSGSCWIETSVLSRWAVYDPEASAEHGEPWWRVCDKGTPGAFRVWECS